MPRALTLRNAHSGVPRDFPFLNQGGPRGPKLESRSPSPLSPEAALRIVQIWNWVICFWIKEIHLTRIPYQSAGQGARDILGDALAPGARRKAGAHRNREPSRNLIQKLPKPEGVRRSCWHTGTCPPDPACSQTPHFCQGHWPGPVAPSPALEHSRPGATSFLPKAWFALKFRSPFRNLGAFQPAVTTQRSPLASENLRCVLESSFEDTHHS
jgi:hypothetical protein